MRSTVVSRLHTHGVDSRVIEDIAETINTDLFECMSTSGSLGSIYKRSTYFRNIFQYIAPVQMYLGLDKNGIARYFHYVSIKQTLAGLLSERNIKSVLKPTFVPADDRPYCDFTDGEVFKTNIFFSQNPTAIQILLYEDALEIVNPLGSAKKNHKILAVYMMVGNLVPNVRTKLENVFLVLLCRELD